MNMDEEMITCKGLVEGMMDPFFRNLGVMDHGGRQYQVIDDFDVRLLVQVDVLFCLGQKVE